MSGVPSEPLSWLVLEQYALGELSPTERARVEAKLGASPADRARLAQITAESQILPALVIPVRAAGRRRGFWMGGLALAASLLLARVAWHAPHAGRATTKGGDVELTLVSERSGEGPHTFSPGERFKVRVTCPEGRALTLAVRVFQGGQRFEPLPASGVRCGENLAFWPGAFALDGDEPAEVCVVWGRAAMATRSSELGSEGVCEQLVPAQR